MEKTAIPTSEIYQTTNYSLAVASGNTIYVSGLVALNAQGQLVGRDDVRAQTEQVFRNLAAVLNAAGTTMHHVLVLRAYVTKREHISAFREVKRNFFEYPFPASTTVIVSGLPLPDFLIQVEAIATAS